MTASVTATGRSSSRPRRDADGAGSMFIDAGALDPGDRAEAIREAIWQLVVRVEIEQPEPPRIAARCRLRTLGQITQCSVRANAHTISRTARLARDDMEPSIFLGLQVSGTSLVVQDGKEALLRPGDLALYDTSRPYTLVNELGIDHHYFRIPKVALALPDRVLDDAVAITWSSDQPLARVAAAYFGRLALEPDLPVGSRSAVSVPSTELVRALVATRAGSERLAREVLADSLVDRALEYARLHLADVTLTPARIAAANYVSVRHLYAAMADSGVSLAGWIRTQRLQACRVELSRPAQRRVSIAAIAARWGFVDAAHFSRAFRAEFGMSPREWRQLSLDHVN